MQQIKYPKVGVWDILAAMWQGLKPQKWVLFLGLAAFVLDQTIRATFVPLSYKHLFDTLAGGGDAAALLPALTAIVIAIAGWNFGRLVLRRVGDFSVASVEAQTMARLRQQAFDYTIKHSHAFFANNFTGSIVQRVSRFARGLERFIDTIAFNLIPLTVTIISAIVVTWSAERLLAYVIIVWVSLFLVANLVFSMWRVKYNIKVAEADSKTTGTLADIIANQNAVSLFAAFGGESDRFKKVTRGQAKITQFTWNLGNLFDGVQAFLIFLAEFFIFYFGVTLWSEGTVTLGTLVLAQVYVIQLSNQLWDFGRIVRTLYEVFADSKEMVEIMKLPHEVRDRAGASALSVPKGEIRFNDVVFNFDDDRSVVDGLSLEIPGGQKVALVGPSGAGKTTFVRLLLRLFDVKGGSITVDGQDISDATLDSLHRAIALVPQDPVLFHRTLLENIRYGRSDATDEEVYEAARLAHCDEFIDAFPEKYATYVGERGVKLSGGERQRIAIARAILKDAPILILDEATSSLDSRSEFLIQDALDSLMKGKTAIVIAHRLSTIRKMDRILVIEGGAIKEDGSHDELLKKPESLYRKLWELQAGGFMLDENSESAS
jgi:ATP-binding cassette subfamily B protein